MEVAAIVVLASGALIAVVRFTQIWDWVEARWFKQPDPDPRTAPEPLIKDPARLAQEMNAIQEQERRRRSIMDIELPLLVLLLLIAAAFVALQIIGLSPSDMFPSTTTMP